MSRPQFPPSGFVPGTYGAPTPPPRRSAAVTVGFVVAGLLIAALIASTVTFAVLWAGAESSGDEARAETSSVQRTQADDTKAREVASKYAIGSATFDYRDLGPWRTALTTGVSPELKAKLDSTAGAMNQMMQPLQWVSKGSDPDAIIREHSGTVYKVRVYVQVAATNVQAPAGRTMVTAYDITLDQARDWIITDVGGTVGPGK